MDHIDIVLIEDNLLDVEMILDSFKEHKLTYKVHVLHDGAEALSYFFGPQGYIHEERPHFPKLILLDLKLPKINGLEILERLKSDNRTRQIPVAVFTSSDEYRDRIYSYEHGANSYMVKPLDSEKYSRLVVDIGSYWLEKNRTPYDDL
jgi:two-component system, response regulator